MHRAPFIVALALCASVSGCTQSPDTAQLQRDVSRHRADCTITEHTVGEGDDEHVYVNADLRCTRSGAPRRVDLGYRLEAGQWRLFHVAFDKDAIAAR